MEINPRVVCAGSLSRSSRSLTFFRLEAACLLYHEDCNYDEKHDGRKPAS